MKRPLFTLALLVIILAGISFANQAHAQTQATTCGAADIIFAAGSGEHLDDRESQRLQDQLSAMLPSKPLGWHWYEVGTESYDGHQYKPISVDPRAHLDNLIGAYTSAGTSNDYGDSVQEGALELIDHLAHHEAVCHDRIILTGYSQGAQVVANAMRAMPEKDRSRIDFLALIGDPKLNLPEGKGFNPPACHGEKYSPWRRTIGDCNTDNGSLGARNPYVPKDMEQKTGLWCNDSDLVCGSSKNPLVDSGHMKYYEDGDAIDQAALEIATRLQISLPSDWLIDISPDVDAPKTGGPDVMILLDKSATAASDGARAKSISRIKSLAKAVVAEGGRIGLQTYGDPPDCGFIIGGTYYTHPIGGITEENIESLPPLSYEPNPYFTPCGNSLQLHDTIARVKQFANWRSSARKTIAIITKAPSATQLESVQLRRHALLATLTSSQTPDFTIQVIGSDDLQQTFDGATIDGNNVGVIDDSSIGGMIEQNTTPNQHSPQLVAGLTSVDYRAMPDEVLSFDASRTLVYRDTIKNYAWDFDGNGSTDLTTTSPKIQHTYSSDLDGTMTVKITSTSGLTDTATAKVWIGALTPLLIPAQPSSMKAEWSSSNSVHLTWRATDKNAAKWLVSLNDFPLGYVAKNQHFLTVGDIDSSHDNTFAVQAVSVDGTISEPATVTLRTRAIPSKSVSAEPHAELPTTFGAATKLTLAKTLTLPWENSTSMLSHTTPASAKQPSKAPLTFLYFIGGLFLVGISYAGWRIFPKARQ